MKGAIHKQHRQLGGEGVKNWSKLLTDSTKNCQHRGGGCQNPEKMPTSFMDGPKGRAQPNWAIEFPDRTGPDTQICRTGPAGPD